MMRVHATRKRNRTSPSRTATAVLNTFATGPAPHRAAIRHILRGPRMQTKLAVSRPNDKYEQEADRIADEVMRMPEPRVQRTGICPECEEDRDEFVQTKPLADQITPLVQRQIEPQEEEEEEILQTKPVADQITPLVQRQIEPEEEEEEELQTKSTGERGTHFSSDLQAQVYSMKSGGQLLHPSTRAFFEPRFGRDFSRVRIHAGHRVEKAAEALNARAFTVGQNVGLGAGQYESTAPVGRRLLAHELTHVVQQGGVRAMEIQRRVVPARVSCDAYPRTHPIFSVINTDDPASEIQRADTRAIEMLTNVIQELTRIRTRVSEGAPAASPLIAEAIARGMRSRLRLNPDDRDTWTRRGPSSAEIIIRWYTNIRDLLQSGAIRYTCIGPDCGADGWAYTLDAAPRRIYLCRNFWRGSSLDNRALTLIHETAHLYYGLEDTGGGAGNAACLEQFVADANGVALLPDYIGACSAPTP